MPDTAVNMDNATCPAFCSCSRAVQHTVGWLALALAPKVAQVVEDGVHFYCGVGCFAG